MSFRRFSNVSLGLVTDDVHEGRSTTSRGKFKMLAAHHAGPLANTNKFQPYNPLKIGLVCRSK